MYILAKQKNRISGGFVHIPFLPEQASAYPGQPNMSLSNITKGIEFLIQTALEVEIDIVAAEGTTH